MIENKAGAGGLIGAETVAKSPPDGYTLLLSANGPILYAPELAPRRPYEWRRDFAPIGTISLTSLVLLFAALLAPAGTSNDIIAKLSVALRTAVADPQVAEQISALGAEPMAMTPEEFKAYLEKEDAIWLPIVRQAGKGQ